MYKVVDVVYSWIMGESGYFDSCVVYVSEIGFKNECFKCFVIMDYDGVNL